MLPVHAPIETPMPDAAPQANQSINVNQKPPRPSLHPGDVPRPHDHAADPLDHLRGALPTGFLLQELLRNKELSSYVLFVRGDRLREVVREVGPTLSNVAGNGDGIDHIAVFKGIQQRTGATQRIIQFFRRARFVVVEG